ncbi:hypothetical protein PSCICN_09340 [Pseudomonas cichorii]|nr:hypothetical protein PSCICN_09340 [Pseudomonas cichorii]
MGPRIFTLGSDDLAKRAGRLVEHRNTGLTQQFVTGLGRTGGQLRYQQQTAAMQQRAPDFPDREVEGKRVKQCPDIVGTKVEPHPCCREQARDIAMLDHHALGLPGRTRGVDHIGQMPRLKPLNLRVLFRLLGKTRCLGLIEKQDRNALSRQVLKVCRLGQ